MNEFLKSLQAFGMEGMGSEEVVVEAYAGSECAEELIELDNLDQATVAMEAMSDAIMEGGLEMQTLALESAGFTLDTASGYTGELSNEAVGNMVKRGYYEVKIQIKKAIQKIWKLILSVVETFLGSEGRLKSYGKLFKKYNERLRKVHPKDGKDGEDREVTVRSWDSINVPAQVEVLQVLGGADGWIRTITQSVKSTDIKGTIDGMIQSSITMCRTAVSKMMKSGKLSKEEGVDALKLVKKLEGKTADAMEALEKDVNEKFGDMTSDLKDKIKDAIAEMKDVDSDSVNIYTAKENLLKVGNALEEACRKDLKFKKELISLRKAWDKKTGEWELKDVKDEDKNRMTAAALRILNKCGSLITGYRLAVSQYYKAVVSNLQGILADMAKVIAKGTNIGA